MEVGLGGLGVGGRADAYTLDAHEPSSRSESAASSAEAMVWMACSRRKRKRAKRDSLFCDGGWAAGYGGVHGPSWSIIIHHHGPHTVHGEWYYLHEDSQLLLLSQIKRYCTSIISVLAILYFNFQF